MTTGTSEFVEALREEIAAVVQETLHLEPGASEELALRIERRVRAEWGASRVYVPSLNADRKAEALGLLDRGCAPEDVAAQLDVSLRTVQRWRTEQHRRARRRASSSGLGRDDWAL